MTCSLVYRFPRRLPGGFTLIEFITVLAVIAILVGMLFPSLSSVRQATSKTRTRVHLAQWAAALEQYRAEYGRYPVLHASGLVNGGAAVAASGEHLFHDIVAGRRRDGSPLTGSDPLSALGQNPRAVAFLQFAPGDFAPGTSLLGDDFAGTEIGVIVDRNLDGFINANDYPDGWPAPSGVLPGPAVLPAGGLSIGAAIYVVDPTANPAGSQFLCSWK